MRPACPKCSQFSDELLFVSPEELADLVQELERLFSEYRFFLAEANCLLADLRREPPFEVDPIVLRFRCMTCQRLFGLDYSMEPRIGGRWYALDAEEE